MSIIPKWSDKINLLTSNDNHSKKEALLDIKSKSKSFDHMKCFHDEDGFKALFQLLENDTDTEIYSILLSIFGNCFYLSDQWRMSFYNEGGIDIVANHLYKSNNTDNTTTLIRMLGNLADNLRCVQAIQSNNYLIQFIVKHGISKCNKAQISCLRALKKICMSKSSVKFLAECDDFPTMLLLVYSPHSEVVMYCLKLLCSLLKTQVIEVCYRAIENEVLSKILEFARETNNSSVKDLSTEILYLITLNSACRVTVASAGAIQIFIDRIKTLEFDEIFKFATRALCLCAREAVSRNKMKISGALPALVDVLRKDNRDEFREFIVASFVWFLFDDKSLALLIRADVIPALLTYLDHLTHAEFDACVKPDIVEKSEESEIDDTESCQDPKDLLPPMPLSDSMSLAYNEKPAPPMYVQENNWESPSTHQQQLLMTSPETSPYYPDSPQFSLPSYSPPVSPEYSPPASPPQYSQDLYQGDGYFSDTDSSSSLFSKVPYHFQSADGIHAMIHGTRGPIHDTLLLLSRFSQAKDPSSFFLYLPGFNSLLNYMLISPKPNQKCARILNRLTLNSHCFDIMVKKQLIPRLYLRLCTGHSLERLSSLLRRANEKFHDNSVDSSDDESNLTVDKELQTLYCYYEATSSVLSLGKLLISNLRSQCESSYGKGVLSHIMLTGSKKLKESCVLSTPYVIWSANLLKRIFLDFKGVDVLFDLFKDCEMEKEDELFVLLVESICSLARSVDVNGDVLFQKENVCDQAKLQSSSDDSSGPPPKKQKLDVSIEKNYMGNVVFILPSTERFVSVKKVLSENSLYFERMFSQRFENVEGEVEIADVDENAFKKMIHFIHGCTISLNSESSNCLCQCRLMTSTESTSNLIGGNIKNDDTLSKTLNSSSLRLVTSSSLSNLMHLYACAERFFVNELKERCKNYLINNLCENTLLPIILLAYRHGCKILQRHCIIYLLTRVDSPRDRIQAFAELFLCQEKDNFLKSVYNYLIESIQSKKR